MRSERLVANLLHYDAVFYDPKETIEVRAEWLLNTSIARFIYLSQINSKTPNVEAKLYSETEYIHRGFFVSFWIGQPRTRQIAFMDTGSDLIWVRCFVPTFEPSASDTYAGLLCSDNVDCSSCNSLDRCKYAIKYLDGTTSEGFVSTEKFTFGTPDEGMTSLYEVVFGCRETDSFRSEKVTGIFRLSTHRTSYSLVKRLGSKFSYCVGNIFDWNYRHNKLIIGAVTILKGQITPLTNSDGLYYVVLEGTSIGEKKLDIDPNVFRTTGGWQRDGVVLDTGSTFTWLVSSAYEVLSEEIENLAKGFKRYDLTLNLCYYGRVDKGLRGFPAMTLHLMYSADLVLDTENIFYQKNRNVFCFGSAPSRNQLSIIGIMAQQNYNMGYDFHSRRLYFRRISCDLLDD